MIERTVKERIDAQVETRRRRQSAWPVVSFALSVGCLLLLTTSAQAEPATAPVIRFVPSAPPVNPATRQQKKTTQAPAARPTQIEQSRGVVRYVRTARQPSAASAPFANKPTADNSSLPTGRPADRVILPVIRNENSVVQTTPDVRTSPIVNQAFTVKTAPIVNAKLPPVINAADLAKSASDIQATPEKQPASIIQSAPVVKLAPVVRFAPALKTKPDVKQAPVMNAKQAPVVNSTPIVRQSPVVKMKPEVKQAPTEKTTPAVNSAPVNRPQFVRQTTPPARPAVATAISRQIGPSQPVIRAALAPEDKPAADLVQQARAVARQVRFEFTVQQAPPLPVSFQDQPQAKKAALVRFAQPAETTEALEEIVGENSLQAIDEQHKPIGTLTTSTKPAEGELPVNHAAKRFAQIGIVQHEMGYNRSWRMFDFSWEAPGLCHYPLYFEDHNLERHGYSRGIAQPLFSAAHFFSRIPMLPYMAAIERPRECIYTLGYYRAGSYAPHEWKRYPLRADAAFVEGSVITGLFFLIP